MQITHKDVWNQLTDVEALARQLELIQGTDELVVTQGCRRYGIPYCVRCRAHGETELRDVVFLPDKGAIGYNALGAYETLRRVRRVLWAVERTQQRTALRGALDALEKVTRQEEGSRE